VTKPLLLVVNPRSAKRATGRNWSRLETLLRDVLPPFDVALTGRAGEATALAAGAAKDYETVVAVGGDGTINEVANGILDSGSDTTLGILPRGTGSDLVRTLGIPHRWESAALVLATGRRRRIDVGRAHFVDPAGQRRSRWFINAAEVGFGAVVSEAVNRPSRWIPGPAAFMWAIVTTMFRHHPADVSVTTDGSDAWTVLLSNAWIANGRYSGGGILSAPRAAIDDGLLDIVVVEHANPLVRVSGLPKLRSGKFIEMRQVAYRQAAEATFDSKTPQPVEVDGDVVGTTPASFEVVPQRLTVVADEIL
jgi:YegS/Rv2252/BmrU family lipid kinase